MGLGNNGALLFVPQFSANGTFITSWGFLGFGDGLFTRAIGIDTDSSGNVYVTDGGSLETGVQKFTNIPYYYKRNYSAI